MTNHILHINSSLRQTGSTSRDLTRRILKQFPDAQITTRDLASGLPLIDEDWINANFTPAGDRSDDQHKTLAFSDQLIAELQAADTIVIGMPVYNFAVPAGLKAWIDLIARAGVTFQYSETGAEGLLTGKRAIIAFVSGGTGIGSDVDFASDYIRHVLGFVGIGDVNFVTADAMMVDADAALTKAHGAIKSLAA